MRVTSLSTSVLSLPSLAAGARGCAEDRTVTLVTAPTRLAGLFSFATRTALVLTRVAGLTLVSAVVGLVRTTRRGRAVIMTECLGEGGTILLAAGLGEGGTVRVPSSGVGSANNDLGSANEVRVTRSGEGAVRGLRSGDARLLGVTGRGEALTTRTALPNLARDGERGVAM